MAKLEETVVEIYECEACAWIVLLNVFNFDVIVSISAHLLWVNHIEGAHVIQCHITFSIGRFCDHDYRAGVKSGHQGRDSMVGRHHFFLEEVIKNVCIVPKSKIALTQRLLFFAQARIWIVVSNIPATIVFLINLGLLTVLTLLVASSNTS